MEMWVCGVCVCYTALQRQRLTNAGEEQCLGSGPEGRVTVVMLEGRAQRWEAKATRTFRIVSWAPAFYRSDNTNCTYGDGGNGDEETRKEMRIWFC